MLEGSEGGDDQTRRVGHISLICLRSTWQADDPSENLSEAQGDKR
jgi:hypothetical protein